VEGTIADSGWKRSVKEGKILWAGAGFLCLLPRELI